MGRPHLEILLEAGLQQMDRGAIERSRERDRRLVPTGGGLMVAVLPNDASVALHTKFGFAPVGVFREVGRKFGVYHDVAWFEKALG